MSTVSLKPLTGRVLRALTSDDPRLVGRMLRETLADAETGEVIARQGERVTASMLEAIKKLDRPNIFVVPFVSEEVEYLSADAEDKFVIAQANTTISENDEFAQERISCRYHSDFIMSARKASTTWMWLRTRWWVSALH